VSKEDVEEPSCSIPTEMEAFKRHTQLCKSCAFPAALSQRMNTFMRQQT